MFLRKELFIGLVLFFGSTLNAASIILVNETGQKIHVVAKKITDHGTTFNRGADNSLQPGQVIIFESVDLLPKTAAQIDALKRSKPNTITNIEIAYSSEPKVGYYQLPMETIVNTLGQCMVQNKSRLTVKIESGLVYGFKYTFECTK